MKRYFRTRIMLASLLSFLIVFLIAVGGTFLYSYHRMEQETDRFIRHALETDREEREPYTQYAPSIFGYKPGVRRYPSGFYNLTLSSDGTVEESTRSGITEDMDALVREQVVRSVLSGSLQGKTGSYKYGAAANEDGSMHVIVLDISIQLQQIYETFVSALPVVAALGVLLVLILLPVSSRIADRFVRSTEKQAQFITDAGHDLKTPVAIIKANLDMLELSQGQSKWSGNIRSQADRLGQLVVKLLMMARLDEAGGHVRRTSVGASEALQAVWLEYLPAMEHGGLRARASIPDGITIAADPDMLSQMFRLLMDNAVRYTDPGGEISLSACQAGHRFCLTLLNSSSRLPAGNPEDLTGRFVRGSAARTQNSGGSGIGLAAVRQIVELHHGRLQITFPDAGHFQVRAELPCAQARRNSQNVHKGIRLG